MTDASADTVIVFKERAGKPGGGTQERRCGAFMGGQGPKARTIAYSETISPSLKSAPSGGNTIPDVVYPINTMVAVRGGRDDMRTCFGVGEPGDPQFTISAAHSHAVCYAFTWRGRENGCNVETQKELAYCIREPGGGGSNPMVLIDKEPYQTDTVKSPPPRTVYSRIPDTDGGRNRLYAKQQSGLRAEETQ